MLWVNKTSKRELTFPDDLLVWRGNMVQWIGHYNWDSRNLCCSPSSSNDLERVTSALWTSVTPLTICLSCLWGRNDVSWHLLEEGITAQPHQQEIQHQLRSLKMVWSFWNQWSKLWRVVKVPPWRIQIMLPTSLSSLQCLHCFSICSSRCWAVRQPPNHPSSYVPGFTYWTILHFARVTKPADRPN